MNYTVARVPEVRGIYAPGGGGGGGEEGGSCGVGECFAGGIKVC